MSGKPIRVFHAFDPKRTSILLIGRRQDEQGPVCQEFMAIAHALYDEHLEELRKEGPIEQVNVILLTS